MSEQSKRMDITPTDLLGLESEKTMNYGQEQYHKKRTLAAKRLADYIRANPEGVTIDDVKANGLTTWGLDRLLKLGHVIATQVRDPERGPRTFHWLWRPIPTGTKQNTGRGARDGDNR